MTEANEVGLSGDRNSWSCPATIDVVFQSSRTAAVRNWTRPSFTPLSVPGNPPPKSKLMLALVRAPHISGPKVSRPMIDCRSVPPTEPEALPGAGGSAQVGTS